MSKTKKTSWTTDEVKEEAKKHKTRVDFAKNAPSAFHAAKRLNILGGYWSGSKIKEEAKKYQSKF